MRKSRLSRYQQDRPAEHFIAGSTARTAGSWCAVKRKTAGFFFLRLREMIAYEQERESHEVFDGGIEVDESCFGGGCKGKRGRGAAGKIPVFGLLKRGGRVHAKIIPDAASTRLMPIIGRKVVPDSIVYSHCWKGCHGLDVSAFHPFRINHSKRFAHQPDPINGTSTALRTFGTKRSGICANSMAFQSPNSGCILKECEW